MDEEFTILDSGPLRESTFHTVLNLSERNTIALVVNYSIM